MGKRVRATIFFELGNSGWSETHFTEKFDSVAGAELAARELAYTRSKLCGSGVTIPYVRLSDDRVRRDSYLVSTKIIVTNRLIKEIPPGPEVKAGGIQDSLGKGMPKQVLEMDPADVPHSALLVRCESGTLYRKSLYLRGAPDSMIRSLIGPVPDTEWSKAWVNWQTGLLTDQWGFKAIDHDPDSVPLKDVTKVEMVDGELIVTVGAHGYASGDKIRIDQIKGTNVPKGSYFVERLTADTFKLLNYIPSGEVKYLSGGKAQKITYIVAKYTRFELKGQTSRKTGRPSTSPVGRRRTVKR